MDITLAQLAAQLGGTLIGGGADEIVTGAAGYDTVSEGEVTFVMQPQKLADAEASPALAIIAPPSIAKANKPLISVADPRSAFAKALHLFDWRQLPLPGIDPLARVAESAEIHAGAYVGPFATIGEGAVIGDGVVIHPHTTVGDHVTIGEGTILYPLVTIYPHCTIGCRGIIHSGAVIGADGHGFEPTAAGWEKIPHIGTVIIEDDVEIGANTCIDRATTGKTMIGHGAKIDNLVHIAHNVQIGPNCMIVAQVGIAGSSVIDAGVVMAGQVGIIDHIHIGAGVRLAARAGVTRDLPAGLTASGVPAQDHITQLRFDAALRKVPALLQTVRSLEKQVAELEARLNVESPLA